MSYGAYRSGSSYGGSGGYSSSVGSSYYDNLTSSPMPGRRNMYQGSSSGSAVYAPLHSSPLSSYSSHTNSSPYLYSASPAGSDHSGLYSSSLGSFAQASYGANLTVNTPSIGSAYSSRSSSASSLRSSGRPDVSLLSFFFLSLFQNSFIFFQCFFFNVSGNRLMLDGVCEHFY